MAQGDRNQTAILGPPRLTGDFQSDLVILVDWLHTFIQQTLIQSGLLDPSYQFGTPPPFDPDNLPAPENTSISRAQQTANEAYTLAANTATKVPLLTAAFTMAGANNQVTLTFAQPLDDTDYFVRATAIDYAGTPALEAFQLVRQTRSTANVILEFAAAPGSTHSIDFIADVMPTL